MRRSANDADRSDEELIHLAKAGNRQALEVLLRRHYDAIIVLCRRLCNDRGDAEDAAQNALISIAGALNSFDGRSRFSTWTYRIATNACLDEMRRRSRRPPAGSDVLEQDRDETREMGGLLRSVDGPEESMERNQESRHLAAALDELGEPFRTPVVLRDLAGFDYDEIADLLGVAPGTVRSRISRGRSKLALILGLDRTTDNSGNTLSDVAEPSQPGNQNVSPIVRVKDDK